MRDHLAIITETIEGLIPGAVPAHLSVTVTETLPGATGAEHRWTGSPAGLSQHLAAALADGSDGTPVTTPLQEVDTLRHHGDLFGELRALTDAGTALESAPWYPVRPGDLVHVHYEATPTLPAFGETYIVGDAGDGLQSMQLLAHTLPSATDAEEMAGLCAVETADDPVYDLWFEAGPHRLTILRDGLVVHDGPGGRHSRTDAAGMKAAAQSFAASVREAERYLERGEPELALARLRAYQALPPCGAPGFTPEQAGCARPRGHRGACSDSADYVEPAHECPALPEELHAVVTVGSTSTDVSIDGLYADREAAVDHAQGFAAYSEELTERYVKRHAHGGTGLELPQPTEQHGVQLAVVMPVGLLPDPRAEDERASESWEREYDYDDDYRDDE